MKVLSSAANTEMQSLEQTNTNTESPPSAPARLLPLAPGGGWYWLRGKQAKAAPQLTPTDQQPASQALLLSRLRRFGRGVMLWVLFWYVVSLMVANVLKDRWLQMGPYYELQKWAMLERLVAEEPDRPLVLMMGSSRTAWAFQASALDGMPDENGRPMLVYNFGVPTSGPCSQLFCLRDMLAKGIRPRFLLIEFLPPLLCEERRGVVTEDSFLATESESITFHRMLQWMPYLQRPGKCAKLWVEARLVPCYAFRKHIVSELKCLATGYPMPKYNPIDNRGWRLSLPAIGPLVHEIHQAAARAGYLPGLSHFRLGKTPYQAMHELLDLCRREKIPSALVLMPEDTRFRSWYSPEAKTAVRNLIDEFRQTYGVETIDAQCWLPDYDFEDGHHALLGGALIFTRRIRAELPRLLAQAQSVKSD